MGGFAHAGSVEGGPGTGSWLSIGPRDRPNITAIKESLLACQLDRIRRKTLQQDLQPIQKKHPAKLKTDTNDGVGQRVVYIILSRERFKLLCESCAKEI